MDFLRADSGLIHGDYNQHNIVVQAEAGGFSLAGVLDLGDCHWAPRLFDVALAGTYMGIASGDVDAVGQVLQGYSERRPVPGQWVQLLKVIHCSICFTVFLADKNLGADPSDRDLRSCFPAKD